MKRKLAVAAVVAIFMMSVVSFTIYTYAESVFTETSPGVSAAPYNFTCESIKTQTCWGSLQCSGDVMQAQACDFRCQTGSTYSDWQECTIIFDDNEGGSVTSTSK